MTPAPKLKETIQQVTKILKSRGCGKTPVFVKSAEAAVELSQVFAKERYVHFFRILTHLSTPVLTIYTLITTC